MTGMTPERLDTIQDLFDHTGYAPWKDTTADLFDEVYRLRAGIETLTEDPTWHRGMYGCPRDMVSTDRLLALLDPTEGEGR